MTVPRDHGALLALLETRARVPFGHRTQDCVKLAAAAVAAQTGRDVLGDLSWSTRREARALLKEEGGLRRAVNRRLAPIAPAMAARGDIAGVIDRQFGIRLMIVEGALLVGPGEHGLVRLPRNAMTCAWTAGASR